MGRLMTIIGCDVAKYIQDSYPVIKKRTALWFFSNELKLQSEAPVRLSRKSLLAPHQPNKIKYSEVLRRWREMGPEAKRKYFNMAEFDEIRYMEQKSRWISEIGALILKHKCTIESINKKAPTYEKLQKDFMASLDWYQKNYEQMIEIETTKTLYKDAIKKAEKYEPTLNAEGLVSAVPQSLRPVLNQPRRPPSAFVLFIKDNLDRFNKMKGTSGRSKLLMVNCAEEWNKLDKEERAVYEDRYQLLKKKYLTAMEQFKSDNQDVPHNYLDRALKEKKLFRRSLRKRLRDASIMPLSIRNAFNFFVMDRKNVRLIELTQIWRNLPPEQKEKYNKMNKDDAKRYNNEREAYNEIVKGLEKLIDNRRSSSKKVQQSC